MSQAAPVAVVIVLRNLKTNKTNDHFPVKTQYTYVQTFGPI